MFDFLGQGFPGLKIESLRFPKLGLSNSNLVGPIGLSKTVKENTVTCKLIYEDRTFENKLLVQIRFCFESKFENSYFFSFQLFICCLYHYIELRFCMGLLQFALGLTRTKDKAILMSTHNIGFYEEMMKIIFSSSIIKYAPYLSKRNKVRI